MRRVPVVALVVGLLVVSCDGTREETTVPTTVALTSTTAVTTTTSTTTTTPTTTVPPFAGIVLLTPEDCDTCDDLADRLTELARGEVPIQVVAAPEGDQRPTVQVMAPDGTVAAEWKGVEATVHPSDRASVENAQAMIRAACDALGNCSPDTTSTTTLPELQPNDFQCGMQVERRYNFDGTRPAPLGAIWGRRVFPQEYGSVIFSGILVSYGEGTYTAPNGQDYPAWMADFCFGELDGELTIARFGYGFHIDDVGLSSIERNRSNPSGVADLLPFGYSEEAREIVLNSRAVSLVEINEAFVVGRQYVFEVRTVPRETDGPDGSQWVMFNGQLADFLRWGGERPEGIGWLFGAFYAPMGKL
jgi:hypothetical protein